MPERELIYMGKPLTECSREELIDAVRTAYEMHEEQKRMHKGTLDILSGRASIAPPPVRRGLR